MRGVPAIAISQSSDYGDDYRASSAVAVRIVNATLAHRLPRGVMLNVNVPRTPSGKVRVLASAGLTAGLPGFSATPEPDGATLYQPRFAPAAHVEGGGDAAAFLKGDITVVPLALDRTAYGSLAVVKGWKLKAGGLK